MSNEFSELFAVDVCLGAQILKAFDGLSGGPREFQEFLSRPPDKKVMRHDADTVQAFMANYIADAKAATTNTVGGHRVNVPLLPVCWYGRKPGLASSDVHIEGPYNKWVVVWSDPTTGEDPDFFANMRMLSVALTYKLAFVARDKPSLDKLLLAWFVFLADTRARNHKFAVPYLVRTADGQSGVVASLPPAEIRDPKSCAFEDESGDGFFAAATNLEVHAPVLVGQEVDVVDPIRLQWAIEVCHGCR